MHENIYVAEYMMKAHQTGLEKKARNAWKWSAMPSRNTSMRFPRLSIRQELHSTVCCEPVPCC